jgi:hypothetical protein
MKRASWIVALLAVVAILIVGLLVLVKRPPGRASGTRARDHGDGALPTEVTIPPADPRAVASPAELPAASEPSSSSPAASSSPERAALAPNQRLVQHPDGSETLRTDHRGGPKTGRPAPFSPETFAAAQRVARPIVDACAGSLPRDTPGKVGLVARLTSKDGQITMSDPKVSLFGFEDSAFADCVRGQIASAAYPADGQPDGSYEVALSFSLPGSDPP